MTREEEVKQKSLDAFPIKERYNKKATGSYDANFQKRKAFESGVKWADTNPRKVYVIVRCEEHDDYIEKVFVDKAKANEYCNKFEGNPNEYGRYYEEMEVTL